MFIIKLLANELLIAKVEVINTGEINEIGQYKYKIMKRNLPATLVIDRFIWHFPNRGAFELARLVLNRLKGIDT